MRHASIFIVCLVMLTGFIGLMVAEMSEQTAPAYDGLKVEFVEDTGGNMIQYEEPFHISIDTSTIQHGWIDKPDNTTVYAVYGRGLFWTDEYGEVPEATKYFGISFGEKAVDGYIKHKNVDSDTWITIDSSEFIHLNNYTFDNDKTYDDVYYTSFATIPANHTRDFRIYVELTEKPKKDNFIIYFGTGSTVLEVTIGTDLKVIQTGLANDTDYVASIDVSEGKLFMSQTNSSYDLTDGLVGWWSFDNVDNGTSAWDYAGNNNHGTMTNMNEGLDNGSSGWTSNGNLSYGMNFDGVDDYVNAGSDSSLDINTYNFTVSAWAKLSKLGTDEVIVNKGLNTNGIEVRYDTSDTAWVMSIHDGGWKYAKYLQLNPVVDTWYHIVAINNGTNIMVYVDGVIGNTISSVGTFADTSAQDLMIGAADSVTPFRFFNGTIDDVRIWNRALTATEISALYNITAPDYETKKLDLHSTAVTYDIVSNTNTSVVIDIPEITEQFYFTPTYIRANFSSATNYTEFNTTDNSFYGNEVIGVTYNYDGKANLTRIRINNTYAMSKYDLLLLDLSNYLSFSPNDITNVWYDSYTGNSDDSTLKATTDYSQWVDTCKSGNTTGQVLCLNFNEIYGTSAHDRSNGTNDGTLTNMNTGVDNGSSGWTRDGKFGNAVKFDGGNDYVEVPVNEISITNGTVSLWMNVFGNGSTIASANMAFSHRNDSNSRIYIIYDVDTTAIHFAFADNVDIPTEYLIDFNEWHFVAITWDGGTVRTYIDGSPNVTSTTSALSTINDFAIIGRYALSSAYYFNGTIDEVKIYNRSLSAAEILADYNLDKDYYDHLINQEGALAANENLDIFITNGSTNIAPVDITFVNPTETDNDNVSQDYFYVNVTFTDTNPDTCTLESNSTNYTMTLVGTEYCYINHTGQSDGTYTYKVYVNDTAGAINVSDERTLLLDTTYPEIDFVSPTWSDNTIVSRNYTYINWTITETDEDTVILNWNGTNTTMTNDYHNVTDQNYGTYTYYVWLNDTAGNQNQTETRTITFDNVNPTVNITDPANTTTQETSTNLYVTLSETVATLVYSVDGAANVTACTTCSSYSQSNLFIVNEGNHSITVYATDHAGDIGSDTVYWTVTKVGGGGEAPAPTPPTIIENITEEVIEDIEDVIVDIVPKAVTVLDRIKSVMEHVLYEDYKKCYAWSDDGSQCLEWQQFKVGHASALLVVLLSMYVFISLFFGMIEHGREKRYRATIFKADS